MEQFILALVAVVVVVVVLISLVVSHCVRPISIKEVQSRHELVQEKIEKARHHLSGKSAMDVGGKLPFIREVFSDSPGALYFAIPEEVAFAHWDEIRKLFFPQGDGEIEFVEVSSEGEEGRRLLRIFKPIRVRVEIWVGASNYPLIKVGHHIGWRPDSEPEIDFEKLYAKK